MLASGNCDALIVSPNTTAALTPAVEEACKQVPVIVFDRGVLTDCPVTVIKPIGGYAFGIAAAEYIAANVPKGGKVLALRILPGVDVLENRWAAAKRIFDEKGIEVVGAEFTDGDRAKTKSIVEDTLTRVGKLDAVWMDAGATSVAAIEAFEDQGMDVPIVTGEDQQDFLQKWKQSGMKALAPTYPTYQWRTPVIAAAAHPEGRTGAGPGLVAAAADDHGREPRQIRQRQDAAAALRDVRLRRACRTIRNDGSVSEAGKCKCGRWRLRFRCSRPTPLRAGLATPHHQRSRTASTRAGGPGPPPTPEDPMGDYHITGAMIWDGSGRDPYPGQVVVRGDRIHAVAPASERLDAGGCEAVDGGGATLLPGLVEGHAHLSFCGAARNTDLGDIPTEEHVLETMWNAELLLDHGFTSAYSAASAKTRLDVVIRDKVNQGRLKGPRIKAASPEITVTGGLGDETRLHLSRASFGMGLRRAGRDPPRRPSSASARMSTTSRSTSPATISSTRPRAA